MLIQICIPVLFIVITVLTERNRGRSFELPKLQIWLQRYLQTVTVLETDPNLDGSSLAGR